MDALPGIGHACGHNLIAVAGVAVAIAVKAALDNFDVSGSVVLLGTPAEEGGSGKAILLEHGAYEGMDACIMFGFLTFEDGLPLLIAVLQVPSYSRSTVVCQSEQLPCAPAPDCRVQWTHVSRNVSSTRLVDVDWYMGSAHAALSPWEGQNALDAAVLAYTNISVLRQQLKPTHRVHGIFEGKDWAPNSVFISPLRRDVQLTR